LTLATETTFVHFRQHNAPYCNWGPPPKRAFSSSDEYKALLYLSGFKGVSSDCANASYIREKKKEQNEGDQDVQ